MRRHDNLIPLTHDHHHALGQAVRLRKAGQGTLEEALLASREFVLFFQTDTLDHFREEEETVFPLIVGEPKAHGALQRVMLEHLQIHAAIRAIEQEIEDSAPTEATLTMAADLLENHIRFEEKTVFPLIEELAPKDLDTMILNPRAKTPALS